MGHCPSREKELAGSKNHLLHKRTRCTKDTTGRTVTQGRATTSDRPFGPEGGSKPRFVASSTGCSSVEGGPPSDGCSKNNREPTFGPGSQEGTEPCCGRSQRPSGRNNGDHRMVTSRPKCRQQQWDDFGNPTAARLEETSPRRSYAPRFNAGGCRSGGTRIPASSNGGRRDQRRRKGSVKLCPYPAADECRWRGNGAHTPPGPGRCPCGLCR